jgi:hypothetical protein
MRRLCFPTWPRVCLQELIARTGLTVSHVMATLSVLELKRPA